MADPQTPGKVSMFYRGVNMVIHVDKMRVRPFGYYGPVRHRNVLKGYEESKERVRSAIAGLIHPGPAIIKP
jgi:hypothetical protein